MEENIHSHVANYGNLMKALKRQGAPGVDCLTGMLENYLNENCGNWTVANWFMGPEIRWLRRPAGGKERIDDGGNSARSICSRRVPSARLMRDMPLPGDFFSGINPSIPMCSPGASVIYPR